jgi:serine/threonine-protein kinase
MERVKAIVDYASELQPDERESFLQQVCSEDPELLVRVRLMLDQAQADTAELPLPPAPPASPEPVRFIFASEDIVAGRYRIIRAIAKGGMGEVYEVEDLELHSRVALKTISVKSAGRPNALEMFRREILLARQVTHPNVCRIYDIGHHDHPEHGDLLFLTMELLQGDTLSHRIRSQGPLTKDEALPLLKQMVEALSAAHRLNIAHRDFKSANVMLCEAAANPPSEPKGASGSNVRRDSGPVTPSQGSGSHPAGLQTGRNGASSGSVASPGSGSVPPDGITVKVTDFGLARSLDSMETTAHGEVWGTPDYMAPEQFHGQSSTASDIYSLGVVIYEMCTAKLPHRSSKPITEPGATSRPPMEQVPAEWQPVLKKCLASEPADRYATVENVWRALNGEEISDKSFAGTTFGLSGRALAAVVLVVAVVIGWAAWMNRDAIRRVLNSPPQPKHIAVLPFENIGGDSGAAAFTDGIGETLTSKLSQLERFQNAFWVVPYSDSKKHHDVEDAYRTMNVTLVVTGSTQRTKDSVTVTTNLIDARTHQQLGSRIMTASLGEMNVLQDRVWEAVADMVELQINPDVKERLRRGNTSQPSAYDFYQQGVGYRLRYDVENIDHAIDMFQKAVARDPNYTLAYAALGEAYAAKYSLTKDPQWMRPADMNVRKALQLDDHLAAVHVAMGEVYFDRGEQDKALTEFRRALEIDPTMIRANRRIAAIYKLEGKFKDAEDEYVSLIARRPGDWALYTGLGVLYSSTGKLDKAAQQFQTKIELQPDNPVGYQDLGAVYMQMGRYDDAINVMKKGLSFKESALLVSNLGAAYMFAGRYADAVPVMERAVQLTPHQHELWRNLADSYRQVPELAKKAPAAYQKALDAAQEELKVNPRSAGALIGAALYYAHLEQKVAALEYIDRALKIGSSDTEVIFTSALVYEIIGDRRRALQSLDRACKSGYSLEVIKHEPELQGLRADPQYQRWLAQHLERRPS